MSSPLTKIRTGESKASTEPRVLALEGAEIDEVFEALSSQTRRRILKQLYEEPSTPSKLAETTDTSLQNIHYHIDKLAGVDLVESVGTRYSEKGAEMSVFAPTSDPLVVVEAEEDRMEIQSRLKRIVGAVSTIAAGSVIAQYVLGSRVSPGSDTSGGEIMLETTEEAAATTPGIIDTVGNFLAEPGAMVLVGGIMALLVLEAVYRHG